MTAQTPIARASAPADGVSAATAVLRALRRIRVPQTQRNRELALLLFALVLNVGAVILVDLGTGRAIDTQAFVYGGLPAILAIVLHVVHRLRARDADPFVLPIATILTGQIGRAHV